jgi:hypothetical protein
MAFAKRTESIMARAGLPWAERSRELTGGIEATLAVSHLKQSCAQIRWIDGFVKVLKESCLCLGRG